MAEQKHEKGDVNWGEVGLHAVVGMAAAPIGAAAGELVGIGAVSLGAGQTLRVVIGDVTDSVVSGMAERWALHREVFNLEDIGQDAVFGGITGGLRLGTGHTDDVWLPPRTMTGADMPVVTVEPTHVVPAVGPESPLALPAPTPQLALPPGPPPMLALPAPKPQLLLTAGSQ